MERSNFVILAVTMLFILAGCQAPTLDDRQPRQAGAADNQSSKEAGGVK